MNYYNEFDPKVADWLRNLIQADKLPAGYVDDRSIADVKPEELKQYTQCHFFAGIGGWSLGLQYAGWPADRPVWTGSCPCQPFSVAGKQNAQSDERHLWPVWFKLIKECQPPVVFGEQVSGAITHGWLDEVAHDLEGQGYACGGAVLPACSVSAPHKRDRLWFVADRDSHRRIKRGQCFAEKELHGSVGNGGALANAEGVYAQRCENRQGEREFGGDCEQYGVMADTNDARPQGHGGLVEQHGQEGREGAKRYPWTGGVFIDCPDGKQRLIEPTIPLLAYGVSSRVVKLRALGNAIVPQVAAEFIGAFMDTELGI